MAIVPIIYFILFSLLAWKNFRWAVFLLILLLPSYLIRFQVFQIDKFIFPSTLLEISFGALFLVWLLRYRQDWYVIGSTIKKHTYFFIAFVIFFLSSVASIFVSDMWFFSFGEWRAYFLEPMILFLILVGRSALSSSENIKIDTGRLKSQDLFVALASSTLSISIFCVFQMVTGWGIATPEWAAPATRRVTAFFSSPNAVGLYLAPLAMLMMAIILNAVEQRESGRLSLSIRIFLAKLVRSGRVVGMLLAALALALFAILFTKSQGAWIGLGTGILLFLFFIDYKKLAVGLAIAGILFSAIVPSMRQAILFKDQANQNRLRLWGYSWTFLEASPKNFILGTGVRQFFRKVQKPYYDKHVMERLIYPHNIFLNFWTEVGLFGMLAVVTMLGYVLYLANKIRLQDKIIGAGLMAMLVTLVVHGLVDVPYFKNDLAFLFWILMASIFVAYVHIDQSQTTIPSGKDRKN